MLRKYLKARPGRLLITGFCFIGASALWGGAGGVNAGEDVLPAVVVRANQEVKWGLYDSKLKMPRGKRIFAQELLDIIHEKGEALKDKDVSETLAANYEEVYQPLDLYQDFADVPDFTPEKSPFSDFNVWVGEE